MAYVTITAFMVDCPNNDTSYTMGHYWVLSGAPTQQLNLFVIILAGMHVYSGLWDKLTLSSDKPTEHPSRYVAAVFKDGRPHPLM